jgi:hypothetical protein
MRKSRQGYFAHLLAGNGQLLVDRRARRAGTFLGSLHCVRLNCGCYSALSELDYNRRRFTQGFALGFRITPFQGVLRHRVALLLFDMH